MITRLPHSRRLATSLALAALAAGCQAPDAGVPRPVVTVSRPVSREVTDFATFTGRAATVADQTSLASAASPEPIYAFFDMDESALLRVRGLIRRGEAASCQEAACPVYVGLPGEVGHPHEGVIDYVGDRVSAATGTVSVRARFADPERAITPGLSVRVRVPTGRPRQALLVADGVLGRDRTSYLLVVNDEGVAARRDVRIGARHEGGLREVTDGVSAGDAVVVDGPLRVRPGVAVEAWRAPMPEGPARWRQAKR